MPSDVYGLYSAMGEVSNQYALSDNSQFRGSDKEVLQLVIILLKLVLSMSKEMITFITSTLLDCGKLVEVWQMFIEMVEILE